MWVFYIQVKKKSGIYIRIILGQVILSLFSLKVKESIGLFMVGLDSVGGFLNG